MATLAILHPVGLQKRLLGSLPKPGGFGTGCPEVVACCALCLRPDANALGLNFVTKCPKEKTGGRHKPFPGASDVESICKNMRTRKSDCLLLKCICKPLRIGQF